MTPPEARHRRTTPSPLPPKLASVSARLFRAFAVSIIRNRNRPATATPQQATRGSLALSRPLEQHSPDHDDVSAPIWSLPASSANAEDLTGQIARRASGRKMTGGYSDVWEGEVTATGESIAIKCLRAVKVDGLDQNSQECKERLEKRLKRETRVLGRVRHPRIASLLGVAMFEGKPSLITPWYENGCATDYLEANPNANRRRLTFQVAEGLGHLHAHTPTIVHSDIKPQNVLIGADGDAVLSDFGLAKLLDGTRTGLTTSNDPSVSIRYASPEALDGAPGSVTSDVYSFACLAYEILTGKPPFFGIRSTQALIAAKFTNVLPTRKPSPDTPDVSDAVWALLEKCWDSEPSLRPTMKEVIAQLTGSGWHQP